MNKQHHQKELVNIRRQIAALRIALDIAINKERELEGIHPPVTSKFPELTEEQKMNMTIDSFRRRKIPLSILKSWQTKK